jgi:dienelactone hydrolase
VLYATILLCVKAPLSVQGWDEAVHEIGKLSSETILSAKNAESLLQAVEDIPVLVIAGAEDSLVSLKSCQAMASKLENSVSTLLFTIFSYIHEICKFCMKMDEENVGVARLVPC